MSNTENASMDVRQTSIERMSSSKLQDTTDTRLQGRSLVLARVVWFMLVILWLLVFIFSLPVYIALAAFHRVNPGGRSL